MIANPRDLEARGRVDERRSQSTLMAGYPVLALTLALGLGATFMVRSIRLPLLQAQHAAARIGAGDLTEAIDTGRPDEIGAVLRALAQMQRSLLRTLSEVKHSTESIGTASREIAAGGQDLSERTEQAASNLQRAASSMEELTHTVRQSGASALQASQLAASEARVERLWTWSQRPWDAERLMS